jgi:hypothetical protein
MLDMRHDEHDNYTVVTHEDLGLVTDMQAVANYASTHRKLDDLVYRNFMWKSISSFFRLHTQLIQQDLIDMDTNGGSCVYIWQAETPEKADNYDVFPEPWGKLDPVLRKIDHEQYVSCNHELYSHVGHFCNLKFTPYYMKDDENKEELDPRSLFQHRFLLVALYCMCGWRLDYGKIDDIQKCINEAPKLTPNERSLLEALLRISQYKMRAYTNISLEEVESRLARICGEVDGEVNRFLLKSRLPVPKEVKHKAAMTNNNYDGMRG